MDSDIRLTQFTGSSKVAERLCHITNGKVRIEDAGFDWKLLGPDVSNVDYIAWQSDQDAYACSGQKCSAQSMLLVHENWVEAGLFNKLKDLAARRNIGDLTVGPTLSVTNLQIQKHIEGLLKITGSKVLFGGKPLEGHSIPSVYGSFEPTAVYVPLSEVVKPENVERVTTEVFGPFQVVTSWRTQEDLEKVLYLLENMSHHLTAGVVSNDPLFLQSILGRTVNGVTYVGTKARTTGAPQNHWFGPAGDPRGTGIGSKEAILHTWTCHREVVYDFGPIADGWKVPLAS